VTSGHVRLVRTERRDGLPARSDEFTPWTARTTAFGVRNAFTRPLSSTTLVRFIGQSWKPQLLTGRARCHDFAMTLVTSCDTT
jgi:hypothetical protein